MDGQEPKTQETAQRSAVRLVPPASDRTPSFAPHDDKTAEWIEAVLARLNDRLDRTEATTAEAIRGLQAAFDRLARSGQAGRGDHHPVDHRFEALAHDLHAQVEDVRRDLVQSLKSSTDNRFAQVAKALEAMGQHMVSTERRSSAALEQVSGEVARLGGAMDQRLGRYENVQSDALMRLSGEIDRIADRLSERIAHSEHRSSQAIADARDEFSRLSSSMAERTDQATIDLSERIRQSEERTARLLEEARAKLDHRVVTPMPTAAHLDDSVAPQSGESAVPPADSAPINPFMVMDDVDLEAGAEGQSDILWDLGDEVGLSRSGLDHEVEDDDGASFFSSGLAAELAAKINGRLAERSDDPAADGVDPAFDTDAVEVERDPAASSLTDPSQTAVPWSVIEGDRDILFAPSPPKARATRRTRSAPPRKAVVASLVIVSVGVAIAGLALLGSGDQNLSPAQAFQAAIATVKGEGKGPGPIADATQMAQATASAQPPMPRASVAVVSPNPTHSDTSAAIESVTQSKSVISSQDYATLLKHLTANDGSGLAKLKRLAELGYAPAQNDLGKLFENGDLGLTKDLSAARLWTERAAKSGVVEAMHRMGLYHYYGQGGAQNPVLAAQWFRRAAERGMLDSQYNLAQLYETGLGVTASNGEAYRWYLIAAQSGDQEALKKVAALKALVASNARAEIERQARAFRAQS